jgi:hypothetical protein
MSDEDTNKREKELQKKREYQRVYEAKHKDEINRRRKEREEAIGEEEKKRKNQEKYEKNKEYKAAYAKARRKLIRDALQGVKIEVNTDDVKASLAQ